MGMDWDTYFLSMCYLTAAKSSDPSTRAGAIAVGHRHEIRSTGYNGTPRRYFGEIPEDRTRKYQIVEHAERNCIYNAALMGTSLDGCTMYCNLFPCFDCARGIIQSGITSVVIHMNGLQAFYDSRCDVNLGHSDWYDSLSGIRALFHNTGVQVREHTCGIEGGLTGFFTGQRYEFSDSGFNRCSCSVQN